MKNSFIHKICSFTLAFSFCLFSIGVPVILGACPMMSSANSSHACCLQNNSDLGTTVHSALHSSCCKAGSVAAERNTNEFLQSKESHCNPVSPFVFLIESSSTFSIRNLCFTSVANHSPPFVLNDIPVRVSSLLL